MVLNNMNWYLWFQNLGNFFLRHGKNRCSIVKFTIKLTIIIMNIKVFYDDDNLTNY
jgi:hypothetical protein